MSKIIKILVPTDFSECAENALGFAIRLADKINASIHVLNVPTFDAPPLDYPSFVAVATEDKIKMSREEMKKSVDKVKQQVSGFLENPFTLQTDIEIGVPDNKIVEVAERNSIDYIIMGTQGQDSTWDKYLGSVAANVLKYMPCPVFVIPKKAKFQEEIVMGYASDFMEADPFEIWKASKLLKPFQSKIVCVHFNDEKEFLMERMEEFHQFFKENVPSLDISFYNMPTRDKLKDMNEFIRDKKINVMVMYKPKRGFFESLFHKSFVKKMALHTEVPLLVLKEN